jgi:hypothetical protein
MIEKVPEGYEGQPKVRASVSKIMEHLRNGDQPYVEHDGLYVDRFGDTTPDRLRASRNRYEIVINEIRSGHLYMPIVSCTSKNPRVANGRHRLAALSALGINEVTIVVEIDTDQCGVDAIEYAFQI